MMNKLNLNMTKNYKRNLSINIIMSHLNISNHTQNILNLIKLHFQDLLYRIMIKLILILIQINLSQRPLTKIKRWKSNKGRKIKGLSINHTKNINLHPNHYLPKEKGITRMNQTDQGRGKKIKSTNKRRIKRTKRKNIKRKSTDQSHVINVRYRDKSSKEKIKTKLNLMISKKTLSKSNS